MGGSGEFRLLVDPSRYHPDQEKLYTSPHPGERKAQSAASSPSLRELAIMRDRAARERNVPTRFVIPDDAMVGIVQVRPKTIEDLTQLRRIDNGIRRTFGQSIVDAVARAEALPDDELPSRPVRSLTPQRESLVSTMNVLVNAIAAEYELPATLLVPRSALERVARELPPNREEFVEALDLAPWRQQLVVDPLWRFLSGRAPMRIEGYAEGVPRTVIGEG